MAFIQPLRHFALLHFRQIRDTVNMIICEQMLVNYISVFKDAYWPGGTLAPHVKVRTDSERFETKEQAQQKLLDNIPGRAAGVACRCKDTHLWARVIPIVFLSDLFSQTRS